MVLHGSSFPPDHANVDADSDHLTGEVALPPRSDSCKEAAEAKVEIFDRQKDPALVHEIHYQPVEEAE